MKISFENFNMPKKSNPEKPMVSEKETQAEFLSEKDRVIAEFKDFIRKHQSDIEEKLRKGKDLTGIFYHDFYNCDVDNPKYREDDPKTQELKEGYKKEVMAADKELEERMKRGHKIVAVMPGYWVECIINGGFRRKKDLGRLYLNLKPGYIARFFVRAAISFEEAGLHILTKIPKFGDAEIFNRFDKMVVYFNADEEEQMLQVLEILYKRHKDAFDDTGTPHFATEVFDSYGQKMQGVGFGEDPLIPHTSFGEIRAKILADVYNDAKDAGFSINDPKFDLEESFRKNCEKYQVDPENPAFNLSGTPKFTEIRRMRQRR